MQIGDLAKRAGVTARTVRYYEELGLLDPPERTGGGFRLYDDRALRRLQLVQVLRGLDFSLKEIQQFMAIRKYSTTGAAAGKELQRALDMQLDRANERIDRYVRLRDGILAAMELAQECCDCDRTLADHPCPTCEHAVEFAQRCREGQVSENVLHIAPLLPISLERILS